eukprot:TRINITY_DN11333_c0_g1_i6.p1 TRINITY_DN11333_c0_g1~~TRINITY_DN11333_c0_g1_i6.p1  ORF type:complete len:717 (-),score=106.78 TRINITY_DN11333_c0_g1_i6:52-2202(-)
MEIEVDSSQRLVHSIVNDVYNSICKDTDEMPTPKGLMLFRDNVLKNCHDDDIVLSNCRLGVHSCIALTKLLKNSQITHLDVSYNKIQDHGLVIVLQLAKTIPSLTHLNVACNNIREHGFGEIASFLATNSTLLKLELGQSDDIKKNVLDPISAVRLADALCQNQTLQYLNVNAIGLGRSDSKNVEAFAGMLSVNRTLTSLDLEQNQLGTRNAVLLFETLANSGSIRHVNFSKNGIGPAVGASIANLLASPHQQLSTLRLQNNSIGRGVLEFSLALRDNRTLLILDLEGNDIGDEGIEVIADSLLYNRTLTQLNVASNRIEVAGGQALAYALSQNNVLSVLDLSQNPIKNLSAIAFAEALVSNQSLSSLDLCSCKIADDGAIALASALASNQKLPLRKFRIRDNYISRNAGHIISEELAKNRSLTSVDFRGNQIEVSRLNKIKSYCKRNLDEIRDAEPKRLREEITRLRSEQDKLKAAEEALKLYDLSIAEIQQKIKAVVEQKQDLIIAHARKRNEIRESIQGEQENIEKIGQRVKDRKQEMQHLQRSYEEKINTLQKTLNEEQKLRKELEADMESAKNMLEQILKEKQSKAIEMKSQIEKARQDKIELQKKQHKLRRELARLQIEFTQGRPIYQLLIEARSLLQVPETPPPPEESKDSAPPPERTKLPVSLPAITPGVGVSPRITSARLRSNETEEKRVVTTRPLNLSFPGNAAST